MLLRGYGRRWLQLPLAEPSKRVLHHHTKLPLRSHAIRTTNTTSKEGHHMNGNNQPTADVASAFGIGALAGVCGSLAGMGGGFVMIPLMTSSLLRLSQHTAHGTSLFAVAATGMAGALGYSGQVDVPSALAIASCGVFTARFGAQATAHLSERTLKRVLGVFMLLVAPIVPAKQYLMNYKNQENLAATEESKILPEKTLSNTSDIPPRSSSLLSSFSSDSSVVMNRLLPSAAIGVFSGFLAGLLGVGGGAVVVPALTLATDMTHYQALGTSLCAMSVPAMVGTFTHFRQGNVAMRIAPALAIGAFIGGYAGGKLGLQVNENVLRWGFSGLMVFLGVRTLVRA